MITVAVYLSAGLIAFASVVCVFAFVRCARFLRDISSALRVLTDSFHSGAASSDSELLSEPRVSAHKRAIERFEGKNR